MGEVLLCSVLFLSGRQIPSLLGDMAYQLCDELYNWLCWSCATCTSPVVQLGKQMSRRNGAGLGGRA